MVSTTACKWDVVIPFEPLWEQYKRIIKKNGAIVLFGSEPFSSHLRMSNIKQYKYDWVWDKKNISNPLLAKKQPLKQHELISVFGEKPNYYPQKTNTEKQRDWKQYGISRHTNTGRSGNIGKTNGLYPKSIQVFSNAKRNQEHPTQKPVALLEYLIKTYTLEGELVLDNCMGSGSTGVACINTNRNFIGIEKDEKYFEIAKNRINEAEGILICR